MNNIEELAELMQRLEPLHPDLEPYVVQSDSFGPYLNHPLVQEMMLDPERCALVNKRYQHKQEAVAKARESGNVSSFIYLHERPYRLDAFIEWVTEDDFAFGADYWRHLSSVWVDSENIWQHREEWAEMWENDWRNNKLAAMDEIEQAEFAKLPDELTVFRGTNREGQDVANGLSWTLSLDKAIWFATRFATKDNTGKVWQGIVRKADVHALLLGRGESEIVVSKVTDIALVRGTPTQPKQESQP